MDVCVCMYVCVCVVTRVEITGECKKLHNAELHTLYSCTNIIRNLKSRRLKLTGHVARMDQSRNAEF